MKGPDEIPLAGRPEANEPEWLKLVREQVRSLKFGTVVITVHDSCVTQVERSEKVRLSGPKNAKSNN